VGFEPGGRICGAAENEETGMSDNEIINASMMANNDWGWAVIVAMFLIVAIVSHMCTQRWVVSGGIRCCPKCVQKYKRAQRKGVRLQINHAPSQAELPCDDCNEGNI
jgi:hypothetical protein